MHPTSRRLCASLVGLIFAVTIAGSVAGGARWTGELQLTHGDDFRAGRSVADGLVLRTADSTYLLAFDGRGPRHLAGKRVTVTGTHSGNRITVSSIAAAGGTSDGGTTSSLTTAATTKRVAVLLFNFQNDTRQPYTPSFATGVMFNNANSVANYFAEESYGQYSVTGGVFGWYTIPYDNTGCSYSAWATAAKSAATAAGVSLSGYTNFVYAFPSASGCGWSGLAYLPGSESWNNNSMGLRTNSHELSHNWGVHHASTISCSEGGVRVSLSTNAANCTASEYGDPFTVMGAAQTRHSHAEHKAQMTWVPTAERQDATSAGSYSVGVNEQSAASPKVVRVARAGATNQWFYLEFRQPFGSYFDNFAATDPAVNGVTIRLAADYATRTQSKLIDTTPGTTSFGDAPLAAGRTFTDPLSGVSITTQSVSSAGATVLVTFAGGGDTQPPTTPGNLVATPSGSTSIALSWSASTDNVGVSGYRVSRNGSQVATVSGTTWTDSGLAVGTSYTYSVVAYDAAGNVSPAASAVGTTGPDTQAPSTPGNLVGTPMSSTTAALSWTASTDNVGVAGYRVSRDGTLVATVTATSWTESGLSPGASYKYSVLAFDAAGNASAEATTVTTMLSADTEAPSAPTLTVTVNAKNGRTSLSWTASTDNVGVAGYRVYRDGALLATTTRTSYTLRKQSGTFTYYVVAFDAAGNVSASSNTATVTVK